MERVFIRTWRWQSFRLLIVGRSMGEEETSLKVIEAIVIWQSIINFPSSVQQDTLRRRRRSKSKAWCVNTCSGFSFLSNLFFSLIKNSRTEPLSVYTCLVKSDSEQRVSIAYRLYGWCLVVVVDCSVHLNTHSSVPISTVVSCNWSRFKWEKWERLLDNWCRAICALSPHTNFTLVLSALHGW